jgi:hypothetical protein
MTDEPVRHDSSERNRRKTFHNAKCLLEELTFLHAEAAKRETNLKYAIHRANTLLNRLKAEFAEDGKFIGKVDS